VCKARECECGETSRQDDEQGNASHGEDGTASDNYDDGAESDDDFEIDTDGLKVERYNEPFVRQFGRAATRVECVKSAMGSGKTTALRKILTATGDPQEPLARRPLLYKRVVVVTPRIQFARTVYGNLKKLGFVLYNEVEDVTQHDRIIIQYESLHALYPCGEGPRYDLVVLDEVESLLNNVTSAVTNKNRLKINASIFKGLVSASTKVVAMDADLSNKTVRFFRDTLNDASQITLSINEHPGLPRDLVLYHQLAEWIAQIEDAVAAGKRIVVVTGSKKAADMHVIPLLEKAAANGQFRFTYYHAKCDDALTRDFENLSDAWSKLDAVVFTPKVTVGADFSVRDHFDCIFAYGEALSVVPRTLLQMCGRCRHPKNKAIHAFVKQTRHDASRSTLASVGEDMLNRVSEVSEIEALIVDLESEHDMKTGRVRLEIAPNWLSTLYMHNRLEEERARANYTDELIRAAAAKGYTTVILGGTPSDADAKPKEAAWKAATAIRFDETPAIDDDEAATLEKCEQRGRASEMDKYKLEKHHYRKKFPRVEVNGEHFVAVRKHMPTLFQICLSLREMSMMEVLNSDMQRWQNVYTELAVDKMVFPKLHLMNAVAVLVGLRGLLDTETRVTSARLKAIAPDLEKLLPKIKTVFGLKRPVKLKLKQVTGLLNALFRQWCGGTFKKIESTRPRGGARERINTYRLHFAAVHSGKTLLDIARTSGYFAARLCASASAAARPRKRKASLGEEADD
jgi:hypothetical protein